MVQVPDDLLMAYVDGELSVEERVWLEGVLANNADLRQRLEPFAVTKAALPPIFDAALRSPVPDRLIETIRTAGRDPAASAWLRSDTDTSKRKAAGPATRAGFLQTLIPNGFGWQHAVAAAVLLVAGVGLGRTDAILPGEGLSDSSFARIGDDGVVAAGRLQVALNSAASSKDDLVVGDVRPVGTFRNKDGQVCRRYVVIGSQRADTGGFACRDDQGDWRLTVLSGGAGPGASQRVGQGGDEQSSDPIIGEAMRNMDRFEALSPAEEAFLIEKGWPGPKSK